MRSLHLVAIELKSSPEFYRLVISSNVLPFCTYQNVANFICYLEFLPDLDVKTLIGYKFEFERLLNLDKNIVLAIIFFRLCVSATHLVSPI